MKKGRLQSKDIDDRYALTVVRDLSTIPPYRAILWHIVDAMNAPGKLVRAKCARLVERGFLEGCACGCRGDFRLTDKGVAFLSWTAP